MVYLPGYGLSHSFPPYTTHRSQKGALLSINHRSSKVTHGGRKAGAQHAHASGASIEDIAHHGNWNHRRLATHYLTQVSKDVPYKMAGFTLANEEFWLERNTVVPPKELQRMIFPFVENLFPGNQDWVLWIENIMDDNPEEFNRPKVSRAVYLSESYPAMRLMIILAHLRKVILQDAVAMLSITDDSTCVYGQHDMFTKHPAFSSPIFREYSLQLQQSMRDTRSPLTDSLTANAPALHHEFRSVKTALGTLDGLIRQQNTYIQQRFDGVERCSDHNADAVGDQLLSISRAIQNAFGNASQIVGDTVTQVERQRQEQRRRRPRQNPQPQLQQGEPEQIPELPQIDAGHELNDDVEDLAGGQELVDEQEHQLPVDPSKEDLVRLENEIALTMDQIQPRNKDFQMKRRDISLNDLFDEWFAGERTRRPPSIWKMNNFYGKEWRTGWSQVNRTHYCFKKKVVMEVMTQVYKAEGRTLRDRITNGVATVQEAIEQAGSISKYHKNLPRKE